MLLIQQVTSNPLQKQNLILPDGSQFSITLYFRPMQKGWFITELVHEDFRLTNLRITVSPNMLNQWRNIIPFGLCCLSKGNREPSLQEDFSSGACQLYVLTEDETQAYAEYLRGS